MKHRLVLVALPLLLMTPGRSMVSGLPDSPAPVATGAPAATGEPAAVGAPPDTGRYSWPLALPPKLTSSFAEYRPGHFHAGIDLSTSGREGIPVLAVEDGEVVRVRASGAGYGRAVYLRLNDGRLAVYAHLSSTMEPLARYVEAVQDSLGLYRVDLYPQPGRFPVGRGQPVGRSGSSGAGAAHFHFELREGDVAVNPLTHGLRVRDDRPPVLRALVFTPLAAGARVNGEANKARVPLAVPAAGGVGELTAAKEIRIWGEVGVGLDGFDRGVGGDRLGLHRVELHVDGVPQFAVGFERFDYNRNHEVEAEFDYEEVQRGRRSVLNLFVPAGILGDFHSQLPTWAGVLEAGESGGGLGPGVHRLQIIASDAQGNETTAAATVRVAGPPRLERVEIVPGEDGGRHLEVDAAGCGSKLARLRVERGARDGSTFTAWREVPVREGEAVAVPIGDDLLDNPHDALRVSVIDETGARSNRLLALAGAAPLALAPPSSQPAPAASPPIVRLTPGTRLATLEVEFASPPVSPPALSLPESPPMLVDTLDPRRFVTEIDARGQTPLKVQAMSADGAVVDAVAELPWAAVPRGEAGTFEALAGRVRIDFTAGAFFEDAYVWVGEESGRAVLPPGLTAVGPVVRVEPAGLPLDRGLWVGVRFDSAGTSESQVGLFRFGDPDGLSFEGSERADATAGSPGARVIGARVRRLGRFVLARDTEPPTLRFLSPTDGQVLTSRRPLLRARVRDRESGFREDDVTFFIDGRRVPTEWNPEADSIQHRPGSPLAPGRHLIVAEATDRSGLSTRREITITVR